MDPVSTPPNTERERDIEENKTDIQTAVQSLIGKDYGEQIVSSFERHMEFGMREMGSNNCNKVWPIRIHRK